MRHPSRILAIVGAVVGLGLAVAGCSVSEQADEERPAEATPETVAGPGAVDRADAGSTVRGLMSNSFERFSEAADAAQVVAVVRATDRAWGEWPRGTPPEQIEDWNRRAEAARAAGDTVGDPRIYRWRAFDVVEVLEGDYAFSTIDIGWPADYAEAGLTYAFFLNLSADGEGVPYESERDYVTIGAPYLLTHDGTVPLDVGAELALPSLTDGLVLTSTDPSIYPRLPLVIPYEEFKQEIRAGE